MTTSRPLAPPLRWLIVSSTLLAPAARAQPVGGIEKDWPELVVKERNFAVRMPGTPSPMELPELPKMKRFAWEVTSSDGLTVWMAFATVYPEPIEGLESRRQLAVFRDGILENAGGTLTSEKIVHFEGHAGLDLVFRVEHMDGMPGPARQRTRFFVIGDTVFQLLLTRPADRAAAASDDAFFASFRLLAPVAGPHDAPVEVPWHEVKEGAIIVREPVTLEGGAPRRREALKEHDGVELTAHSIDFTVPGHHTGYVVVWLEIPAKLRARGTSDLLRWFESVALNAAKLTAPERGEVEVAGRKWVRITGTWSLIPDAEIPRRSEIRLTRIGDTLLGGAVVGPEIELNQPDTARFLDSLRASSTGRSKRLRNR